MLCRDGYCIQEVFFKDANREIKLLKKSAPWHSTGDVVNIKKQAKKFYGNRSGFKKNRYWFVND
ncbi:hypothetical protein QWZ13_14360 [Reinekea marina]|nr:hypothetical protein [Reinekea marina]MDN3650099.1 hypothetical protein [Reinekea marina]